MNTETLTAISHQVIGILVDFDHKQRPIVQYELNQKQFTITAETLTHLRLGKHHIGLEVFITLTNKRAVLTGVINDENDAMLTFDENNKTLEINGQIIDMNATESIILKCGKSEIRLTKDGKVTIKGRKILSRAKASNSIKGGSVKLN